MEKYAIYGAGAFGGEVFLNIVDVIKEKNWEFLGFVDDILRPGSHVKHGKIIGGIDFVNNLNEELNLIIAIGNPLTLKNIAEKIYNPKIAFPNIIHPSVSFLEKSSLNIGKGNIISHLSFISYDVKIGDFNIFNTRNSLGHHLQIGSFNVFHPNVQLSGNVKIGNLNSFGFNSGIIPGKKVGNQNTFGPGCILMRNTGDESLYVGNPAQKLKL